MRGQITITQSLTTVDLFKASIISALGNKRLRTIIYLVPSIVVLTSLPSILLSAEGEWWLGVLNMLAGLAFLVVFFYGVTFILSFLMINVKSNLFKNVTYTFNNWGMIKSGKNVEFKRPWDKFIKWRETRSFFLLYTSESDAHVILKGPLHQNELEEVRQIIEKHLGLFPSKK